MEEQIQGQNQTVQQQAAQPVTQPVSHRRFPFFLLWVIIGCLILGIAGWFSYQQIFAKQASLIPDQTILDHLPTYFSYTSDELQILKDSKKPDTLTTIDDLYYWEEQVYALVAKNKTVDPSKLYTYLLVARRDALLITRSIHKDFYGDTSIISRKIICEFYPDDCQPLPIDTTDEFSATLADVILQKVKARIVADNATTKNYVLKNDPKYWYLSPQLGLDQGSYKPWLIEKGDQFRVPENPEFAVQNFTKQLAQVTTALKNITSDQRKAVIFWAGGPGTKTPPGIWLDIAGEYMKEKDVSVEKYVDTQAVLAMAIADSLIGCFDSKYTYQVKRPYMVDPTIKTVMPTPNHPSYPAGHSCVSSAAATVLSSQLPEYQDEWQRLALEAGKSRVWGGIHYPADDEQGTILGQQVGAYAINRFTKQ